MTVPESLSATQAQVMRTKFRSHCRNKTTINYAAIDRTKTDFGLNISESLALDAGVVGHEGGACRCRGLLDRVLYDARRAHSVLLGIIDLSGAPQHRPSNWIVE